MAGAFLLVALFKKQIILGQRVPDVADHRKPSRRLGRGVTQAAAVHGVVCDGAEFMIGDVRRQIEERGLRSPCGWPKRNLPSCKSISSYHVDKKTQSPGFTELTRACSIPLV